MDCFAILAEAATETTSRQLPESFIELDWIWGHITSLNMLEAFTFVSFGAVCLFYGWRVFKILVIISFTLLGGALGMAIGDKIGGDNNPLLGIILAIVVGALSVPMMRWAVSALGGIAGAILTAGIWYAANLPEQYIWAGGLIGAVAGAMISFIVFKIAVMLFSSLGGSGLVITGMLALLYLYPQTKEPIKTFVFAEEWFLPVALIVTTVVGIYWQNRFIKEEPDWSV